MLSFESFEKLLSKELSQQISIYNKSEFDEVGEMLDQTNTIIYDTQDLSNKIGIKLSSIENP